jgi:hypothetical protein
MNKIDDLKDLQNEAFWKGLRVIQSCENEEHLKVAKRYANRFIELYCRRDRNKLTVPSTISHQYEVLQIALKEQSKKLN